MLLILSGRTLGLHSDLQAWRSGSRYVNGEWERQKWSQQDVLAFCLTLALWFGVANYFQLYSDIAFVKIMPNVCKEVREPEKCPLSPSKPPCSVTTVGGGLLPPPQFYCCGQQKMNTTVWVAVESHRFKTQNHLGIRSVCAGGRRSWQRELGMKGPSSSPSPSLFSLAESSTPSLRASILPLVIFCFNCGRGGAGLGASLCVSVFRSLLE